MVFFPQRLKFRVRGHPVRLCTPHNLCSQDKTIKPAATASPLAATEQRWEQRQEQSMVVEEGGKERKNNATVCIFQDERSFDSHQETRNEHKLSPSSGGHRLNRMSHHYKYNCNIEGQCLRKNLKSTGLWPGSRKVGISYKHHTQVPQ